jgi:hypothetical protein
MTTKSDITTSRKKLELAKQLINELTELGEDYAHFQSAQHAHKTLKKIRKQINTIV